MAIHNDELYSLARRDPLSFGVLFIDLLDGKAWEHRPWAEEIYSAVNPWSIERHPVGQARRLSVIKPTQIGMSTMGIVRMLHFANYWPVRIMYTLPRQMDVLDMASTRIDPTIQASPLLRSKLGSPDSAHAKRIGDSFIYLTEMSVEARMLPIDALFIDEVDLSDPNNVSTAMNRLDASRWKLSYYFSTPTLPNYGIDAIYTTSDMRRWVVRCPACGHDQVMDWDANLRVIGAPQDPKDVYFGCARCGKKITPETIQAGRWVAEKPSLSGEHVGFQLSQIMTHSAGDLYRAFRDPQTRLVEFYRKRLGKTYQIGGGSVDRDDFLTTCFDEPYSPELIRDESSAYFMGVDQGNEIQVVVYKVKRDSRRRVVVHVEIVPQEKGFGRVEQLVRLYRPKRCIIDANPNRHPVKDLTAKFPGRVVMADYVEMKQAFRMSKADGRSYFTNITINRTEGFDGLIETIKAGEWALPGDPASLSSDVELLIDHVTAMKRDVETRKTPSGEVPVGVYRSLRPDHLAHSMLYAKLAYDVDGGRRSRIAVIGRAEPEEEPQEQEYQPDATTAAEIISLLAEVPLEQLAAYASGEAGDGSLPFPLSYKMGLVKGGGHEEEDIAWAVEFLIEDKKKDK